MWGRIVPELPLELYSSRGNQVRLKCHFRMVPLSECSVCVPIYIYIYIYYTYTCMYVYQRGGITAPWWKFFECDARDRTSGVAGNRLSSGAPVQCGFVFDRLDFRTLHPPSEPPRPFALLKFQRFKRCDHFILRLDPMIYVKTGFERSITNEWRICVSTQWLQEHSNNTRVNTTILKCAFRPMI